MQIHELILGGQKSGKSRCAEGRAAGWLAAAPGRSSVMLATALAGDGEMRERIARHRQDRAARVPSMRTVEVPHALAQAVREHGGAECLLVIDCLTLWLTQLLMPLHGDGLSEGDLRRAVADLQDALRESPGPVVCVSNEIGLGLSPMTRETRRFVDELGRLHQGLAARFGQVTLMVAGLEWPLKRTSP
jgi:adenosylcobinamide kinase/adenosylcobinamide-phosphate guanylyltransferase